MCNDIKTDKNYVKLSCFILSLKWIVTFLSNFGLLVVSSRGNLAREPPIDFLEVEFVLKPEEEIK